MKLKIAVVQFRTKQFFPEKNIEKAKKFIIKAKKQKAKIIVFPEDFITGPITDKLKEFADSKSKYFSIFQNFAKKYKINIVPGSIIIKNKQGFFNTTCYINSEGKIKSKYQKINLWHSEKKYLTYGNKISVFNTEYGKIGLIICWDLFFPNLFRKMCEKGVKIIICPSCWTYQDADVGLKHNKNSERVLVDSISIARAFENEIIFIYCNGAGKLNLPNFKGKLLGHSQITVPFKGMLKKLNHNKEEMFIEKIDTKILEDAEKAYKIRTNLNKII